MVQMVKEVMTSDPVRVSEDMPLVQVAELMRDRDIGDVVVGDDVTVVGIVTDRDIVVRGVTAGEAFATMTAGEICSRDLRALSPDDPADAAVKGMREAAVRRLPVMDDGELVGIVSIGDLAKQRDPNSALSDISEAAPNN